VCCGLVACTRELRTSRSSKPAFHVCLPPNVGEVIRESIGIREKCEARFEIRRQAYVDHAEIGGFSIEGSVYGD
jgi:hypothetical protein